MLNGQLIPVISLVGLGQCAMILKSKVHKLSQMSSSARSNLHVPVYAGVLSAESAAAAEQMSTRPYWTAGLDGTGGAHFDACVGTPLCTERAA